MPRTIFDEVVRTREAVSVADKFQSLNERLSGVRPILEQLVDARARISDPDNKEKGIFVDEDIQAFDAQIEKLVFASVDLLRLLVQSTDTLKDRVAVTVDGKVI